MSVTMVALAKLDVNNKEAAQQYSEKVKPVLASFGGKPLGRYRTVDTVVGEQAPNITLLVEFESAEKVKACFESDEYKSLVTLRDQGFAQMEIYTAEV